MSRPKKQKPDPWSPMKKHKLTPTQQVIQEWLQTHPVDPDVDDRLEETARRNETADKMERMPISKRRKPDPLAYRQLFRPKLKELSEQCASCPFRNKNHKAWTAVVNRLAEASGVEPNSPLIARAMIRGEASRFGDFICHCTAYNPDMTLRDPSEHRQCPGATEWFRTHLPLGVLK